MDHSKQAVEQLPSPPLQWQKAVQQITDLMTTTILTLSVTTCLTIMAYRASGGLALLLAQALASVVVLLNVGMSLMLTRLVAHAAVTLRRLQSGGKRTVQSKHLRKILVRVAGITLLMWIWAICMTGFPFSISAVKWSPETGIFLIFLMGFMLIFLLMNKIIINQICSKLIFAIDDAEKVAQRTLIT
ncbi:hypothetical protein [Xanthomonas albilineans]|uniref:hypothetical protein n=1 Tax=Xanthomonas albilineans TaxID=29447 RepID=UPI0005F32D65|nr:hypothetical protein [Xanthomonas albilineans]